MVEPLTSCYSGQLVPGYRPVYQTRGCLSSARDHFTWKVTLPRSLGYVLVSLGSVLVYDTSLDSSRLTLSPDPLTPVTTSEVPPL